MNYITSLGFALAIVALLSLVVSGIGYRWGFWEFSAGIALVKYAAYLGFAAVAVSLVGIAIVALKLVPQPLTPAWIGLVLGGFITAWTLMWKYNLNSVPYIHDITTDTSDPPLFVAILPLRAHAPNTADYGGPELAKQQLNGYPHLKAGSLNRSPVLAFPQALQAAKDMGWEIVAADADAQRIEATDTTLWFGFKDDVVVRLTPSEAGSRIDVRSVSRVGKSDVGTNARRIEAYLARVARTTVRGRSVPYPLPVTR